MGPYLGQRHTLDILTARPVTFAYGHLFRAVHDGGDHDQYIVHYGGEDQYEGDEREDQGHTFGHIVLHMYVE